MPQFRWRLRKKNNVKYELLFGYKKFVYNASFWPTAPYILNDFHVFFFFGMYWTKMYCWPRGPEPKFNQDVLLMGFEGDQVHLI
jgi:hypothetical protein